jgi:serine/threonine protein kinase/Tol biopolymer transport system component
MNTSASTDYADAPYPRQVEIDDICDRFEAELKARRRPRVEEFVRGVDPQLRVALARELLKLELDYRRDEAQIVREEYRLRFPEIVDPVQAQTAGEASLKPGALWGDFCIERQIGAGGMGVVYEAYDTKLERKVAVKFLPNKFAQDRERLVRFEREAKILAGLNHPNIATLHDLRDHQGIRFLVLEFVPGQTLAEILGRRRIAFREVIAIFSQIADALESAHEAGVVHRDLKPSNVKITADGNVKVLDFGLATSSEFRKSDENQHANPLERAKSGHHGICLPPQQVGLSGTISYMSPEQTRGGAVDKRTDIWAFGCCLYEALTREKAFPGETPECVLQSIVDREPDWTLLPSEIPASIARVLRRCLTKDPRQRLRDLGDARIELLDCQHELSEAKGLAGRQEQTQQRTSRGALVAALLAALVVVLPLSALLRSRSREVDTVEARVSVPLPSGIEIDGSPALAMSPDGRFLAYVAASKDGVRRLFVRRLNEFHTSELNGTEGAIQPFFSPDGQTIGFFADHDLKTVSVSGGSPTLVCDAGHSAGGCWTTDGRIVFGWNWGEALDSISPDGSARRSLARAGDPYVYYWPELLPDGKTLLFGCDRVMMADLNQMEATGTKVADQKPHPVLIRRGSFVRYINGHLAYGHRGTLYAVPFELDPPRLTGSKKLVAGDLWTSEFGSSQFAVSKSGDIAYVPGNAMEEGQLVWRSRRPDDPPEPVWPGYRVYHSLRLSPNGKQLAIGVLGAEGYDVWIYDFETRTASNLDAAGENQRPIWSPDGKRLVFLSDRNNLRGLYVKDLGTKQPPKLLAASPFRQAPVCLSKDDKKLIYFCTRSDSSSDILELDMQHLTTRPLLATSESEVHGGLSPGEDLMVYLARATQDTQVFVCSYPPNENAPTRIATDKGGLDPMWSPVDDNEIFYLSGDGEWLMSARIARDPLRFVEAKPIVSTRGFLDVPGFSFDYDPITDRFLLVQSREDKTPKTEVRLVLGWSE